MVEPKAVGKNPELDVLKAKISHLTSEIDSLSEVHLPTNELKYDDVVKFLENEIASAKDYLTFETEKRQQLINENRRLLKYTEEEEKIVKCINDYLATHRKCNESSIIEEKKEIFFKLEVLHRKVISFIKKFSKRYFTAPSSNRHTDDLFLSQASSGISECARRKSLLDILSLLIFEIGQQRNVENSIAIGILHVDDTVPQEYIEMLICADIIERCTDPSYVKLK